MEGREKGNNEGMVSICMVFDWEEGHHQWARMKQLESMVAGFSKTNRKTMLAQSHQLLINLRHHHASATSRDPAQDFIETLRSERRGRRIPQSYTRERSFTNFVSSLALRFLNLLPSLVDFYNVPPLLRSLFQFCGDKVIRLTTF